jgi:hypothetical protein
LQSIIKTLQLRVLQKKTLHIENLKKKKMAEHNNLEKGEDLAWIFEENGYKILERNWTFQKAEIDIIAQKKIF